MPFVTARKTSQNPPNQEMKDIYDENYKTLMKEIENNTTKLERPSMLMPKAN